MPRSREQKLHDEIALSNEKHSISHEHLKSHINDLKNENEMLKKKSNELNEIFLKFTNGQKMLDNMLNSQKMCIRIITKGRRRRTNRESVVSATSKTRVELFCLFIVLKLIFLFFLELF